MISTNLSNALPYSSLNENEINTLFSSDIDCSHMNNDIVLSGNNNDFLSSVDPDVNVTQTNMFVKTKYYNIPDFNKAIDPLKNISILLTNIRSSKKI